MGYRVMELGAAGDGKTNDAHVIQKAIDLCSEQGGGVVIMEGGHTYLSGSIVLKSHVELVVETGAVLKASEDLNDYQYISELAKRGHDHMVEVPTFVNCEYDGKPRQYFIYSRDTDGVRISGGGVIDGSEEIYYGEVREDQIDGAFYPRIPLILMEHCTHLTIQNVTIRKSGFWTTHLVGCEEVEISGVRILNNRMMANCDGIDPDHCKHVRISNCHIEAADDCIVLKTTEANHHYGPCEDIVISGCTLASTSAAIKIGTESVDDFKDIIIDNCSIYDTNRGISFQLRDQGNIENVLINNCVIRTKNVSECWWGFAEPINIASINRKDEIPSGKIKGLSITNVRCKGEGSIYIAGKDSAPIEDLTLNNIRLEQLKQRDAMQRLTDFLNEVGMLRHTPRSGYKFLGSGQETVAEHSHRTAVIGYVLAKKTGADAARTVMLCLFHDLPEARTGDFNYVNRLYDTSRERDALEDAVEGTGLEEDIMSIWDEHACRTTPESLLAHDADQLDLILNLKRESDLGNRYADKWLESAVERLRTDIAKELAQTILKTDHTDWWYLGPDRNWWERKS